MWEQPYLNPGQLIDTSAPGGFADEGAASMKIEKMNGRRPLPVAIFGFDGVNALDLDRPA